MNIQSHDSKSVDNPGARAWLNGIISDHPDHKAILATHDTWQSTVITDEIITQHDNIILSNAGHDCVRTEPVITQGPGGGKAYNFVSDYQCDDPEVMRLRYYVFKPLEDIIYFYTYLHFQ